MYVVGSVNSCLDYWAKVSEHFAHLNMKKIGPVLCGAPLLLLTLCASVCAYLTPSLLISTPHFFMGSVGLIFAYIQIRLIVQNISKEPFKPFYNVQLPFVVFTFFAFLESVGFAIVETTFLIQIVFLFYLGLLGYLIFHVVMELSTILNISVFTITPKVSSILV